VSDKRDVSEELNGEYVIAPSETTGYYYIWTAGAAGEYIAKFPKASVIFEAVVE